MINHQKSFALFSCYKSMPIFCFFWSPYQKFLSFLRFVISRISNLLAFFPYSLKIFYKFSVSVMSPFHPPVFSNWRLLVFCLFSLAKYLTILSMIVKNQHLFSFSVLHIYFISNNYLSFCLFCV